MGRYQISLKLESILYLLNQGVSGDGIMEVGLPGFELIWHSLGSFLN